MRIFLDENLSEYVAEALNLLNRGYFPNIEVVSTKYVEGLGKGAEDEEILPFIGKEQGVLISRDRDFARVQAIASLCKEHNVPVVFIRLPEGSDRLWDLVRLLIEHWEKIIEIMTSRKPYSIRLRVRGKIEPL